MASLVILLRVYLTVVTYYLFILAALGLHCCAGVPLVAVHGLHCSASRVAGRRLQWLQRAGSVAAARCLWSTDSAVAVRELTYSMACVIFLDQRPSLCLLHWQSDSLSLSHQGSPHCGFNVHLPDDESADHLLYFIR